MCKNLMAVVVLLSCIPLIGCDRGVQAMTPDQIERQYGVSGAYADTVATSEGPLRGTTVPVTLANGQRGQLFIPAQQRDEPHAVYIRDEAGIHPVQVQDSITRDQFIQSPSVVGRRAEPQHAHKRSWEQEALIVGGSAGGGAAIGALAGGKKGAGVGAAAGGIGGLIYDLATRKR
ncbi:MAG TPA: hypothetical protein VGY57_06230 [Vicinamibacterales bacterium]|jgi:hypothetical protein|nr:hypothetical protein [Vicinamibacterales bacterium]